MLGFVDLKSVVDRPELRAADMSEQSLGMERARVGLREWLALGRVVLTNRTVRYGERGGPLTVRFAARLKEKFEVPPVLTVNSGTCTPISSLAAAGIGPGDEVLLPAYTWVATPAAVAAVDAVPILGDIDDTLTHKRTSVTLKARGCT